MNNSQASLASLTARGKDASDGSGILFYMSVFLTLTPSFSARRMPREVGGSHPDKRSSRLDRRSGRTILKKISLANYRQDRYYSRIVKATEDLLRERGFVAPIELFIRMELLSPDSVEDWRRGRILYLERVIRCNLSKASRILCILRMHAHDLDLEPQLTVYKRWTKGPRTLLRFSKTGNHAVEDAYARHFLSHSRQM